jgi:hypothetical protein
MDPRIADFIRDNRRRYTREAIRQQLIEAGHDPAEIDATWAALDAPDPDATAGEGFWGRFWLFLLGLNGAVFFLVFLATGMVNNFVLAVVFAIALVIGALMAWGVVAATGPAKLGRTTAMVIGGVIPLVFALLIGGTCYALVGAIGPPPLPATSGVMELHIDPPFSYDGTGRANCQPYRDESGFSIFAEDVGRHEGRMVNVSIDVFRGGESGVPAPAPGRQVGVYLGFNPSGEGVAAPFMTYVNTGTAVLDLEGPTDGSSGTLAFEGLEPEPIERPPDEVVDTDPISGTITWTCE